MSLQKLESAYISEFVTQLEKLNPPSAEAISNSCYAAISGLIGTEMILADSRSASFASQYQAADYSLDEIRENLEDYKTKLQEYHRRNYYLAEQFKQLSGAGNAESSEAFECLQMAANFAVQTTRVGLAALQLAFSVYHDNFQSSYGNNGTILSHFELAFVKGYTSLQQLIQLLSTEETASELAAQAEQLWSHYAGMRAEITNRIIDLSSRTPDL